MVRTTLCLAGGTAGRRKSLAGLLASAGFEIVGSYADADACAGAAGSFEEPELVLMLAPEHRPVGEADVTFVKRMYPEASAVILGGAATRADLTAYVDAGLDGYLPATIEAQALGQSLRLILLGEQIYVTGSKAAAAAPARLDQSDAKRSVAHTSSCVVSGSYAECPAVGVMRRSASGKASCSAQAVSIGHTTSYRPWTITVGMRRIAATPSSSWLSLVKKPRFTK